MALVAALPLMAAEPTLAFRPGQLWNDVDGKLINAHGGGILHHQGVYYWYGEHKDSNTSQNHVGINCYSSRDLYRWKFEGVVLPVDAEHPSKDLIPGGVMERPKVLYNARTKKFVLWFHLELKGKGYTAARSGVAVGDSPTGRFQYLGSMRPNNSMARDMTLFQDDDGKAYHFYSSEENATMHVSLLSDDYTRPSGTYKRIFIGKSVEAPAVFKRNGRYFLFGSGTTGWDPNPMKWGSSDAILGDWKYAPGEYPVVGPGQNGDKKAAEKTFHSQATFVIKLSDRPDAYMFMADRWNRSDFKRSAYVWLPIEWKDGQNGEPFIRWHDSWDISFFGVTTSLRVRANAKRGLLNSADAAGLSAFKFNFLGRRTK